MSKPADKGKTAQAKVLSKGEVRQLQKKKAIQDRAVEQQLVNLGGDIGVATVDYTKGEEEVQELVNQVQEDLVNSVNIVQHVTTSHFNTQHEYEQRMNRLKDRIAGLESQLKEAETQLAELKAEKKQVLSEKDSVIENQKREMKEMAYQFSDMLMKTLITITEDFESQTSELGRDDASTIPDKNRLKEFNLNNIRI